MLTHTPLDLTPFARVLIGAGLVLQVSFGVAVVAILVLLLRRKTRRVGAAALALLGLVVVGLWLGGPSRSVVPSRVPVAAAASSGVAAAIRFEQLCKAAGERIERTATGVRGILLLNLRPDVSDLADQFRLDDPYGRNCGGESCLALYLFDQQMVRVGDSTSFQPFTPKLYDYVDFIDPADGVRRRFTKTDPQAPLVRSSIASTDPLPRYAVKWLDVSTVEDRELGIAGGSIQVIDLASRDVIAERIGYLRDVAGGNRAGFRTPWSAARSAGTACPDPGEHNQAFVTKVLKPSAPGGT